MLFKRKRKSSKPLALLVAAHPIWNVPPFVNAANQLAAHGYRVIVIGYQSGGLPRRERICPGASILRLSIRTREVKVPGVRRFLAVLEFLARCRSITRRLRPDVLITFNDPGAMVQRITGGLPETRRVTWLLEYPELERFGLAERTLMQISAACWSRAEVLVVPTQQRLALHLSLRPDCTSVPAMVIQNAPLKTPPHVTQPSPRTLEAVAQLEQWGSDQIRIIYSGAIGDRYGADSLIRAVGSFPEGVRLLLLGKKHELAEKEVRRALQRTAHPQNIVWVDEIPYRDLPLVLQAADVGFATYRGDTLNTRFSAPGKLYEYLKSGLVLLSDEDCCIHADVSSARCGVFFPKPVDDDGIRRAVAELLHRRRSLPEMKQAARRLFETRLCMEHQIRPLINHLALDSQIESVAPPPPPREPVQV